MNQLEVFYAETRKKKVSYTQLGITSGGLGWASGYLEPIMNSKRSTWTQLQSHLSQVTPIIYIILQKNITQVLTHP